MRPPLLLLLALTGCGSLPSIQAARTSAEQRAMTASCLRAFPTGLWSSTHSIDAAMPLGHNALLIGVTAVNSAGITTVLLSPEGLTLFEALSVGDQITVKRVLPPLDKKGFARALVDDVRGTFIPPSGSPTIVGHSEGGIGMCRWQDSEQGADNKTTDVVLEGGKPRWVRMFSGNDLVREVELLGEASDGWYPNVVLRTHGIGAYTLNMQLIRHEEVAAP